MAVSNGQTASSNTFNNAFISRTANSNTTGKVDLQNAEAASGSSVTNIQREHNSIASFVGKALNGVYNLLPTWTNVNVGSASDNLKQRIESLTFKFSQIAASEIISVPLKGYARQATNLTGVTGTSVVVTTEMTGKTPSTGTTVAGVVVTTGYNKVYLAETTSLNPIEDGSGNRVYGRITESTGVWTLSFFVDISGVETAHNITSSTNISWWYQELFNPLGATAPVYSEEFVYPSDNLTADIVDASATQRGVVSTGTQSFAGNKTFTGTISASNLSGTNTGDVTLGAIGSTPNANGSTLSGQTLNLEPANETYGGVLSTILQKIAGFKNFVTGIGFEKLDVATTANIVALSASNTYVRFTGSTATNLHGIDSTGLAYGKSILLVNASSADVTIKYNSGTASANDRILIQDATDYVLKPNGMCQAIYDYTATKWVLQVSGAGSGGGGGGISALYSLKSGVAPIESEEFSENVYLMPTQASDSTIRLYSFVKVPASYQAGAQIFLYLPIYSPSASNTVLISATSYLVRKNTDAINSTTNSYSSTNSALTNTVANMYREVALDLTSVSGQINSVAVSPGDIIRVEILRGSDTDTAEVRMIQKSLEVKLS